MLKKRLQSSVDEKGCGTPRWKLFERIGLLHSVQHLSQRYVTSIERAQNPPLTLAVHSHRPWTAFLFVSLDQRWRMVFEFAFLSATGLLVQVLHSSALAVYSWKTRNVLNNRERWNRKLRHGFFFPHVTNVRTSAKKSSPFDVLAFCNLENSHDQ